MITQRDLECEIKELQLEIEDHQKAIGKLKTYLERKELQLKEMTNQTPCNYRTPTKYNVEYLDDKMVIVNGVQYQKVEEPKPQTLQRIIEECMLGRNREIQLDLVENILDRVEVEFLTNKVMLDEEEPLSVMMDYRTGWENCIKYLKERVRE